MNPGAPSPRSRFTVVSVRPHEATVDARTRAQRDLAKLRALLIEKLAAEDLRAQSARPGEATAESGATRGSAAWGEGAHVPSWGQPGPQRALPAGGEGQVPRVKVLRSSRRAGRAWPASSRMRSRSYVRA